MSHNKSHIEAKNNFGIEFFENQQVHQTSPNKPYQVNNQNVELENIELEDKKSLKNSSNSNDINLESPRNDGGGINNSENAVINNEISELSKEKSKFADNKDENKDANENEDEKDEAVEVKPAYGRERVIFFSRNKRIGVFCLIIIINVVANFDDGTIPAVTEE